MITKSEYRWPSRIPTFSVMACFGAVMVGGVVFGVQFKKSWTPLQRVYLSTYTRTAFSSLPGSRFRVLYTVPGGKVATARDIARGSRVEWRLVQIQASALHRWLQAAVYQGRSGWNLLRFAWGSGLAALLVLLPLGARADSRRRRELHEGSVLRGTNLITRSDYHRLTRDYRAKGIGWETEETACSWWERIYLHPSERAKIRIRAEHESQHFLVVGSSGTRKSSIIRCALRDIQARGGAAVVWDPAGEFVSEFLLPSRGDIILNPGDLRQPCWNPADEVRHQAEADAIAESLFPDRQIEEQFFIRSPRKIFSHLLKYKPTLEELLYWLDNPEEIDKRVEGTALAQRAPKDAPQQRSGVLGNLEDAAAALRMLPATGSMPAWSATEWAKSPKGWVFVSSTPETRTSLRPLVSLWLDWILLRLMGRPREGAAPVFLVLDEMDSLNRLPTIGQALFEGRKSQVRILLGFQAYAQIEARYGKAESSAMLAQPRTRITLRTSDASSAEYASKSIGEVEVERLREGRTSAEMGLKHNRSANYERRVEYTVLPSEIQNLPDGGGYLQADGYTVKLRFNYVAPRMNQPALMPRVVSSPLALVQPSVAEAVPPSEEWTGLHV